MNLYRALILFIIATGAGCSAVQKSIYLKPEKQTQHWQLTRNKNYKRKFTWKSLYYPWSTKIYHSCDTASSVGIYFGQHPEVKFIGPPLLPLFPTIFRKRYEVYHALEVRVVIHSADTQAVDTLLSGIKLYYNGSQNSLVPYEVAIHDKKPPYTPNNSYFCESTSTGNTYIADLKFTIIPDSLRSIKIDFSNDFNSALKSQYEPLVLDRKNKRTYYPIGYWPF